MITGGTSGLGYALAKASLHEGAAHVFITGRDEDRGRQAAQALSNATYIQQDVTREQDWTRVMSQITEAFGHLDVLANNAGSAGSRETQTVETVTLTDWRQIFATNVEGVLLGCRAALHLMKKRGGSVINMSSTAALSATPSFAAYGAAKAAVTHLTKSFGVHCGRNGYPIRCNSLHPALVDGGIRDQILGFFGEDLEASLTAYLARVPLGALAETSDVASAFVYLASEESRYVTGAELVIGGGLNV